MAKVYPGASTVCFLCAFYIWPWLFMVASWMSHKSMDGRSILSIVAGYQEVKGRRLGDIMLSDIPQSSYQSVHWI